ncbi:hypothetical protein, partial [Micromonospora sp. ATA51]|uniref:hypothetical protein n=1 Tax=Micromonospora sp. ATA51 TaxID=2806098 RepID=UPI001A543121
MTRRGLDDSHFYSEPTSASGSGDHAAPGSKPPRVRSVDQHQPPLGLLGTASSSSLRLYQVTQTRVEVQPLLATTDHPDSDSAPATWQGLAALLRQTATSPHDSPPRTGAAPRPAGEEEAARKKHDDAAGKLRRDVERAYQHYAYLVRAGELYVEFKRFDDDSRTALNGAHVWTALLEAGRAAPPAALSAGYLAALLDGFDRALTPREVVQSFYKNPSFPLVTSTDEIRRVLFELLTAGWELIDADGNPVGLVKPVRLCCLRILVDQPAEDRARRILAAVK